MFDFQIVLLIPVIYLKKVKLFKTDKENYVLFPWPKVFASFFPTSKSLWKEAKRLNVNVSFHFPAKCAQSQEL